MPLTVNTPNGPVVLNSDGNIDPGGQGGTDPNAPKAPPKRVVNTQKLPGGLVQVTYEDGTYDVQTDPGDPLDTAVKQANLARTLQLLGNGSGSSAISAGVSRQNTLDQIAEQARQFNENMGFEKAKFNENYALDQGKTLLGLGSRPDTLIKYLYAIRGLQTPQQLQGTTTNLPGFQNIMPKTDYTMPGAANQPLPPVAPGPATPVRGASVAAVPGASTNFGQTAAPLIQPRGGTQYSGYNIPTSAGAQTLGVLAKPLQAGAAVPGTSFTDPNGVSGINVAANGSTVSGGPITGSITSAQAAAGPKATVMVGGKPVNIFASGGVIPEPVVGMGMHSGQMYMFGEKGPEAVVPNNMMPQQMQMPQGGMNAYADGGTIGYNPNVFNPASLPGIVQRGYNSTPDVPLLPSVGIATGGGQSLIPSAQRINSLLPSEQQAYSGFLQDEAGVQPDDIYALAKKLAPKVTGLTTPRYS